LPSGGGDLLQSENRVNIKPESEVNVEAGIGQLFIVVGGQTADFVVKSRKYEMAAFDTRQSEKYGVTGRDSKVIHHHLKIKYEILLRNLKNM
jgi:hypothetical protein